MQNIGSVSNDAKKSLRAFWTFGWTKKGYADHTEKAEGTSDVAMNLWEEEDSIKKEKRKRESVYHFDVIPDAYERGPKRRRGNE